mgnify:CR=1 FL=1
MDYHTAMLRLESAPTRARDWINQNKIDYAIREILDPMKSLMTSRNVLKFQMGGETIFAAHTHPRGFAGYKIIESIENWGFYERFLEKLIDGANKWLQEVRMV